MFDVDMSYRLIHLTDVSVQCYLMVRWWLSRFYGKNVIYSSFS
jgi:hypothetical protein